LELIQQLVVIMAVGWFLDERASFCFFFPKSLVDRVNCCQHAEQWNAHSIKLIDWMLVSRSDPITELKLLKNDDFTFEKKVSRVSHC